MAATALGELYLALTCFWASGKTQAAQAKARTAAFPSQLATEAGAEEESDRIRDQYHRFRDWFAEMTPEANITRVQSECDLFRAALSTARQDASPANLAALTKAVENALAASMAGYDNGPETAKLRDEITAALPAIIDITRSAESAPVRVVILTAIQAETEAVLRHLADRDRQRVSDTWFHTGRFNSWTIAVAEAGPGNAPAATIATRAFAHFNPEIAAFIGVAGGVKDVTIGDVVVATKVYAYESGKETPHGFLPRPEVQKSHHELEQRARVLRSDTMWHRRLDIALWSDRDPHVYIGPIAAGEAVVATNAGRIATLLKRHYSDALAVEMEGRGFLEDRRAAHRHQAALPSDRRRRIMPVDQRVDETYVKIRGEWYYLYRAVDRAGRTVDFRLSARRDVTAAKAFFRKAIKNQQLCPRTIALDGYAASHRAVHELKADGSLRRTRSCARRNT
jgi:nucleoside phosphorylase